MHPLIETNRARIAELCRRHGVRRLEAFGSILGADFDPERSDVDIVVQFDSGRAGDFHNLLDLKESLESLFGRSVDLVELHALRNQRLRQHIRRSMVPVYAAA
jgi:uncharacterized protein